MCVCVGALRVHLFVLHMREHARTQKRPYSLMELCAVNARQDQEMSHKQPHGCHFSFPFTELCVERRQNVNAKHCFCEMAAK